MKRGRLESVAGPTECLVLTKLFRGFHEDLLDLDLDAGRLEHLAHNRERRLNAAVGPKAAGAGREIEEQEVDPQRVWVCDWAAGAIGSTAISTSSHRATLSPRKTVCTRNGRIGPPPPLM